MTAIINKNTHCYPAKVSMLMKGTKVNVVYFLKDFVVVENENLFAKIKREDIDIEAKDYEFESWFLKYIVNDLNYTETIYDDLTEKYQVGDLDYEKYCKCVDYLGEGK